MLVVIWACLPKLTASFFGVPYWEIGILRGSEMVESELVGFATISKSIFAYDMTVSDDIYDHCKRCVSRERLQSMRDHEQGRNMERLRSWRAGGEPPTPDACRKLLRPRYGRRLGFPVD
jgi:hypothetical protein